MAIKCPIFIMFIHQTIWYIKHVIALSAQHSMKWIFGNFSMNSANVVNQTRQHRFFKKHTFELSDLAAYIRD